MSYGTESLLYTALFRSNEYKDGISNAFSTTLTRLADNSPFRVVCVNSEQEAAQWSHHLWEQCGLYMSLPSEHPNTAFICPSFFDLSPEPRAPNPDLCPQIHQNHFVLLTKERKKQLYTQGVMAMAMAMEIFVPSISWHLSSIRFSWLISDLNDLFNPASSAGDISLQMTSYCVFGSSMTIFWL